MSNTRARSYGRRANNPFSQSTFMIDGLSQFDWSHTNSWSQDFGDLRPIECYDLIMGTRMRCNLSYVLNMDPLRKPLYAGITTTYDAIYISDMLLGYDSESFFNPSEQLGASGDPKSRPQPRFNAGLLLYTYYAASKRERTSAGAGNFMPFGENWPIPRPIYNTLYDAFGYPFNSHYYDILGNIHLSFLTTPQPSSHFLSDFIDPSFIPSDDWSNGPWLKNGSLSGVTDDDILPGFVIVYPEVDSSQNTTLASQASILNTNSLVSSISTNEEVCYYLGSPGQPAANLVTFMSCLRYLLRFLICLPVSVQDPTSDFESEAAFLAWCKKNSLCLNNTSVVLSLSDVDWDLVCRFAGFGSYSEFLDVYKSYLYSKFYAAVALNKLCDFRPIFAYRRAYNDLYVNTNLWDCDDFAARSIDDYYDTFYTTFSTSNKNLVNNLGSGGGDAVLVSSPARGRSGGQFQISELFNLGFYKRWFTNDMFTSAVPADMSAAANAVEIPSTGLTLIDLRNLNIDQMVNERINYAGNRVTDSTFAFFGFKSPELRYRFARHISRMTDSPRIDNVLQNSQTSSESPLGTPAGYGYGAKTGRFFDFQMPWYGFIMILSSVMTEPVYRDSVDRMLMAKDYEDFLFPPYQEISDIAVTNMEIQPTGSTSDSEGFGYQRSYYYYMRQNNKLRGTMRLSEKIDWNLSRDMRDGFALNSDFATPSSSDRFNRIFADTSDGINHFNFFAGLDIQVTLPLKRDIHYHL